ncbi:MAG: hypothetical protein JRS35_24615 [Deltaproteobacteria bacterium]|nr:hypothetical protein [Deltaproteobacteria bacterium]
MALVVSLESSARTETLRWSHPDAAGVEGYRVYYGTETGVYTSQIDIGAPAPDPNGVLLYDLDVDDAATIYVAVTAYAGDQESIPSNEQERSPSESSPPPLTVGIPGRPTLVLD